MSGKTLGRMDLDGFAYVFQSAGRDVYAATKFKDGKGYSKYLVSLTECECKGYRMNHKTCRHMSMLWTLLNDKHLIGFSLREAREIAHIVVSGLEPFVSAIMVDEYVRDDIGQITGVKIKARSPSSGNMSLVGHKDGLRVEVEVEGRVVQTV
jgi:hypothetical protein